MYFIGNLRLKAHRCLAERHLCTKELWETLLKVVESFWRREIPFFETLPFLGTRVVVPHVKRCLAFHLGTFAWESFTRCVIVIVVATRSLVAFSENTGGGTSLSED